jgi:hypothetical protein
MLKFFENGALSRIFGPEWEEDGFWRKLRNDELHNLYPSPNVVRVIRWAGHVSCKDGGNSVYRISVGRPKSK